MGRMKDLAIKEQEEFDDSEYFRQKDNMTLELGKIVMTRSIDNLLKAGTISINDINNIIAKQKACDWGLNEYPEDKKANDEGARTGQDRCMGVHMIGETKVYIITEQTREYTTILLPEDY